MMGLLTSVVLAGAALVGLLILGAIFLIALRLLRPGGRPRGTDAEEVRLLQEIHRGLARLEDRVEALETLVLDPSRSREGWRRED